MVSGQERGIRIPQTTPEKFHQLERDSILKIVDIAIEKLEKRLKLQNIKIDVTKQAKEFIADKGYDQNFGARPLRRAIQRSIEDPLSEEILKGNFKNNSNITIKFKKGSEELIFTDSNAKEDVPDKNPSDETIEEHKEKKE